MNMAVSFGFTIFSCWAETLEWGARNFPAPQSNARFQLSPVASTASSGVLLAAQKGQHGLDHLAHLRQILAHRLADFRIVHRFQPQLQPRQRRAHVMANRRQRLRPFIDQTMDAGLHRVEGADQVAHIIGARFRHRHLLGQADPLGRMGEVAQRRQGPPDQHAAGNQQRQHRDQRQAEAAEGEGPFAAAMRHAEIKPAAVGQAQPAIDLRMASGRQPQP